MALSTQSKKIMLRLAQVFTCLWIFDLYVDTGVSAFQALSVGPVTSRLHNHHSVSWASGRSSGPLSSSAEDAEDETNYDTEETLMTLHFAIKEDVDKEFAMARMSRYCQSFPFAAVLPVQPLQYLPTTDGGVDVRFLRKKTQLKGSVDGGLRLFITEERDGIDVVAKRNSQGQTVSKVFSEKLVVQSFLKRITGEDVDKTSPPPTDIVTLTSVFHKWMD